MIAEPKEKQHSASSALIWTYAGVTVKIVCQLGIGIAIARMLGPEPYGLVATSTIIMSLCSLLADGGISASLIHHQDASDQEIAGAFWAQLSLSCVVAIIIVWLAPVFVGWLNAPDARIIVQVTAIAFPLYAVASISTALLRRKLNMKIIQISMICSYLFGYGAVGIILATKGYGVWSLVLSQLAQAGVNVIILLFAVRPPLKSPAWPKRMLGYGGWVVLNNITAWSHGNMMNIALARVFGVVALGQFNRLGLITKDTVPLIGGPIQQVLFPVLSRTAGDNTRHQQVIRSTFQLIGLLFFPAMLIMFLFPHEIVAGVFGAKFLDDAEMLSPLALAAIGSIFSSTMSSIFFGSGKPKIQWFVQLSTLPLTAIALWYFSQDTIIILCWGFSLSIWMRAVVNLITAIFSKVITATDLFLGFGPAIFPAVAAALCAWFGFSNTNLGSAELQLLLALALAIIGWLIGIGLLWSSTIPSSIRIKISSLAKRYSLQFSRLTKRSE